MNQISGLTLLLVGYWMLLRISNSQARMDATKIKLKKFKFDGCTDPTEPFQCLGSNVCIPLQYVCDGHPDDCPNNSDENEALCIARKRPPIDLIRRLIYSDFKNYGLPYINYLFGSKAAQNFNTTKLDNYNVNVPVNTLARSLIISPDVNHFAKIFEMTDEEKERFINVLESLHSGKIDRLPKYIVDSGNEGLTGLIDKLIKTNFLRSKSE